jgi:cytochrome c554/c'-like protein
VKIVARSKQGSGRKRGPPKSIAASLEIGGAGARREDVIPWWHSRRTIVITALVAVPIVVAAGIGFCLFNGGGSAWNASGVAAATFVGSDTCAGCHQAEAKLWRGSHHQQAMDHATEKSVLGNFNDASFDYYGVHSRFFRKDGKFLVETDGPDGKLATFEVK